MNSHKQRLLLEYLVSSPDVYAICESVLDPLHFDADVRPAVSFVKDYHRKYSAVPDIEIVAAETGVALSQQVVTRDRLDYCVAEIEDFAKKKAILHAVGESADLIKEGDFGMIEQKLKAALAVSVTKDIGISLFDDARTILHRIAESERPISTGFDDVDKKLFGGLVRKQMMVISGPSGGGKSVFMNNIALNYVESGHRVLFISLELSQDLNYLRFAAMMSGSSLNGWFMNIDDIANRVDKYQGLYGGGSRGNLFIKRLAMGSKPSHIRAVLKEFELVHGVLPDVLVVDYLDIMGSDVKVPVDNVSLKDKYAAEGLREIGNDLNLIVVTGSQIKKEAQNDVDIDASQTAGGQTKMNTADVWGNIMLTDEMKAAGIAGVKWLKTRTSDGRGQQSLMSFNPISLRIANFSVPPSEEDMKRYTSLTTKTIKSSGPGGQQAARQVVVKGDPLATKDQPDKTKSSNVAGWLASMVTDGDEEQ